ncbi:MAG: hypothetical protein V3T05_00100 [Myxococcota bacterium]
MPCKRNPHVERGNYIAFVRGKGRLKVLDRGIQLAQLQAGHATIDQGVRMLTHEHKDALKVSYRLVIAAGPNGYQAEIVVRLYLTRLSGDCRGKRFDCLRYPSIVRRMHANVV